MNDREKMLEESLRELMAFLEPMDRTAYDGRITFVQVTAIMWRNQISPRIDKARALMQMANV